jgi:hypothetical protein
MSVLPESMRLIILPITVIYIAVCVDQSASSIGLVALPVPVVDAAVGPDLVASAMPLIDCGIPFAIVLRSILESLHLLLHLLNAWLVVFVLIEAVLELW